MEKLGSRRCLHRTLRDTAFARPSSRILRRKGLILGVDKLCTRRQLHMPQAKKDVDRPGSQRRRNGKFRGMVLERLGGRTLDVELAARRPGVQDVHFIREVLFQAWRLRYLRRMRGGPECIILAMSGLPEGVAPVNHSSP